MGKKKGGSIASSEILKQISNSSFAKLSNHFTNLVGGCSSSMCNGNYKISNASTQKGGNTLQYSIINTGRVQSNENTSTRTTDNNRFLSQQSISSLPTTAKQTVYGIPTDNRMNFSYISNPIFKLGGKRNKK